MKIPFLDLTRQNNKLKKQIDTKIGEIVSSGRFIMGPEVENFESEMASYLGTKTVSCANGSDALFMALKAIGINPGDEVITSTFTFFATAGAIVRSGGTPVFVDIERDTFNMNPELIENRITQKTKAIIPVHLYGNPVNMGRISKIAKKHNIKIIEDACQSIGAMYKGTKTGALGDIGCFSFFPTKNLGGFGDGGLLSIKNEAFYEYLKYFRVHGAEKKYYHSFVGINSRLDALQAAVLRIKLKYLDEWNYRRKQIAHKYSTNLKKYVKVPSVEKGFDHVFHQYCILTNERDQLKEFLGSKGIATGVYYPLPLHMQKCFENLDYKEGDLPVSEVVSREILSLPIFPEMKDQEINFVIKNVVKFFER